MNIMKKLTICGGLFELDNKIERIKEIENKMSKSEFWNDTEEANKLSKELSDLKKQVEEWSNLKNDVNTYLNMWEQAIEENQQDDIEIIEEEIRKLINKFDSLEMKSIMSDKDDIANSYVQINSGAGGTEACDWVSMLLRMYLRWCEQNGYTTEIIDQLNGEEAGIKNVTFMVKGEYAYGYLKSEIGIHRLVRISPFDSNARRHTSFASVFVYPEITDDIDIDLDEKDLRIDRFRASGAGGQHVNTTDSAIRITHIPTNIVVTCQNERSQHKNLASAMKNLKSKLYNYYKEIREKELDEKSDKKDISWGNQIRSYVFQPYNMVKDLRTGYETGNVNAVMDGDLNNFIYSYLRWNINNEKD